MLLDELLLNFHSHSKFIVIVVPPVALDITRRIVVEPPLAFEVCRLMVVEPRFAFEVRRRVVVPPLALDVTRRVVVEPPLVSKSVDQWLLNIHSHSKFVDVLLYHQLH